MIPRAKYHPAPPTPNLTNYTTFDARKPSVPVVSAESKLLSYLDAGPNPLRVSFTFLAIEISINLIHYIG